MHTVGDIVEFVLQNRGDKLGFKNWSKEEIARGVIASMKQQTMIYGTDSNNQINAVMIGYVNGKIFRVVNILTTVCGHGKLIVKQIMKQFPDCTHIQFEKRGTLRTWPLNERMLEHLKGAL